MRDKDIFYVYLYLDPVDLQPFYVGKGKGKRRYFHLKGNKFNLHFDRKIKKIQKEGLEPLIIIYQDQLIEEDAFALEKELIVFYGRKDLGLGTLYNMTDGGEGISGFSHSDETKNAIRIAHMGVLKSEESKKNMRKPKSEEHKKNMRKPKSEEHKKAISTALTGMPLSEEHKKAMSIARTGVSTGPCSEKRKKAISIANKGRPSSRKGISTGPLSEEHKKNMSLAHKGKPAHNKGIPMKEEQKAKLSAVLKGKSQSEEQKKATSIAIKESWRIRKEKLNEVK